MNNENNEKMSRRDAIRSGAILGAAALVTGRPALAQDASTRPAGGVPDKDFDFKDDNPARDNNPDQAALAPGEPGRDYTPVVVPNGWTLPYKVVEGTKVFHMVAEEVYHEFAPGLRAFCWGYNGIVHGPVIEAVEGDRVRIYVTNLLAAPTTIHWHGILLPSGMDGVGGLSQKSIQQGETYMYEFTLRQHGTFMYHSHHDEMTQMGMGMTGMFVIHPRKPKGPRPDRDFVLLSHEWDVPVGADRPNPNEMTNFNVLTFNAKAYPGTAPLVVKLGDRVRIRFGNLSAMDHHPIHLHGYYFKITETDGGPIPEAGQWPETTVLVAVGSTRTVEFLADNPGNWAMHCHMTHHVMNQMGHDFPNMIGVDTKGLDQQVQSLLPNYMSMGQDGMGDMGDMGMAMPPNSIPMMGAQGQHDYITMGGMFTILKVRETLPQGYDVDPGDYADLPGELVLPATADALRRDGINADSSTAPRNPRGQLDPSRQATPTQGHSPHKDGTGGGNPAPGVMRHTPGMNMNGGQAAGTAATAAGAAAVTAAGTGAAATSRPSTTYTCTMHPEVVSDKPGKCPKCGMKLVAKK